MLKIEDFIFETCIGKGGTSEVYLGFFLLYIFIRLILLIK
jgi:hypothetical protein